MIVSSEIAQIPGKYYVRDYCQDCKKWRSVLMPFGPGSQTRICDECGHSWKKIDTRWDP